MLINFLKIISADFAYSQQLNFQSPASLSMDLIIDLHNYVMFFICCILGFVLVMWLLSLRLAYISHLFYFVPTRSELERSNITEGGVFQHDMRHEKTRWFEKKIAVALHSLLPRLSISFFDFMLNLLEKMPSDFFLRDFIFKGFLFFCEIYIWTYEKLICGVEYILFQLGWSSTGIGAFVFPLHIDTLTKKTIKLFQFRMDGKIHHSSDLEIIWTIIPSLILLAIAIPSLWTLYILEEPIGNIFIIVKVIGHQWYWSYEISDRQYFLESVSSFLANENNSFAKAASNSFDSYMIPSASLVPGQLRLLEVDNALFLPIKTPISFIVTADDVLHSWAVPSLGVKLDAVPGRLNQAWCYIYRKGEFYGQCSELCGVQHGFMPIKIISYNAF